MATKRNSFRLAILLVLRFVRGDLLPALGIVERRRFAVLLHHHRTVAPEQLQVRRSESQSVLRLAGVSAMGWLDAGADCVRAGAGACVAASCAGAAVDWTVFIRLKSTPAAGAVCE
jgi:hypothetical protein